MRQHPFKKNIYPVPPYKKVFIIIPGKPLDYKEEEDLIVDANNLEGESKDDSAK
jgi:hypothetical protein